MNDAVFVLTLGAALGSGLMAGMMYAFSTFVMKSFAMLEPAHGIEAMQVINRVILNPWFLGVFMGTTVACLVLAGLSIWQWTGTAAGFLLAGCVLYVVGMFLVTAVFNVPMNNALEAVEATTKEAAVLWQTYLKRWTFWNHVRTVAAMVATVLFIFSMLE